MKDLRLDALIPTRQLIITKFYPNRDTIPDRSYDDPSNTAITEKEWVDENVFNTSQADDYYKNEVIDDIVDDGDVNGSNGNEQLGPFNPDFDNNSNNSSTSSNSESTNPTPNLSKEQNSNNDENANDLLENNSSNSSNTVLQTSNTSSKKFKSVDSFEPQEATELGMNEIDSLFN